VNVHSPDWQDNKLFWKTIQRLRGKISHTARSIKDENVLLSNEEDILGRLREYVKKDHLNPVAITPLDTHEMHLGEENANIAAEAIRAV